MTNHNVTADYTKHVVFVYLNVLIRCPYSLAKFVFTSATFVM